MNREYANLKKKVTNYQEILTNTRAYRQVWKEELRDKIVEHLKAISEEVGLDATVNLKSDLENLEAIVFSLGTVKSGMYQEVNDSIKRHMIKHNGSLIYQQLFNGKIIVIINYPYIENYGQPTPPKTIAIYRPEELKDPFLIRHLEELMTEAHHWEDYDDDERPGAEKNQKIGFKLNFEKNERA